MPSKFDINTVAEILGVTPTTLRRWDADGTLSATRESSTSHRYYFDYDIENFLSANYKYLNNVAVKWAFSKDDVTNIIPSRLYCADSSIFKARLSKLEKILQDDPKLKDTFSLVTSVVGEIGNNSFDHNIGNWPDATGIFFGINLPEKKIILADRGQGVLATLKKVRNSLSNDKDALTVAFTEIISGRPLETRGNGLKYVKRIVMGYTMNLWFQSGRDAVTIDDGFSVDGVKDNLRGCFAILDYKGL